MSCYHPNRIFIVGLDEDGKKITKFTSSKVEYIVSRFSDFRNYSRSVYIPDGLLDRLEIYDSFLLLDSFSDSYYCFNYVDVPCGQCIGCRIDYSRDWANRMMLEASYYDRNCFLTLTYDDLHVPKSSFVDRDGNEHLSLTLRKKHFQDFMKRLRSRVCVYDDDGKVIDSTKIRFYCAGEYGSNTMRPHYHVILFNWFPDDAKFYKHDSRGYDFYTSELVSSIWPYGFHLVSHVSWETCAYTARYVTKKLGSLNKDNDIYSVFNIEREFSLMSRKPGLARRYFDDHKLDIYGVDKSYIIRLSTVDGALKFKPPRYFDSLFDLEDSDRLAEIKDVESYVVDMRNDLKLSKTDLNYYELLEVEESNFKDRVTCLKGGDLDA